MDDVIRFDPVGTIEGFEESEFGKYVFASDFDAALAQSRILAADQALNLKRVKREFESMRDRKNSIVDLQQRLTAAEQRNAALETAIRHALDDSAEDAQTGEITIMQLDYETLATLIDEPTESGASDEHPLRP